MTLTRIISLASLLALVAAACAPGSGSEVKTASGLKYVDQVVGTGEAPQPGDFVKVHYTGTL